MRNSSFSQTTQLPSWLRAYIILDVEPSVVHMVVQELRSWATVAVADVVNSNHEAIAVVEGDASQLAGTLFIKLKKMAGVRSMMVLIAHDDPAVSIQREKAIAR